MYTSIFAPSRRYSFAGQDEETFSLKTTREFAPGTKRSTRTTFTGTDFEAKPAARTFADDPFRARFGHRLPRGLREEARGMEWRTFMETFCSPGGDLSLQNMQIERLRAGKFDYTITMADQSRPAGEPSKTYKIMSTGAISAMTQILANEGRRVEIAEFHQYNIYEATATIIYTMHNNTRIWTVGFGATPEISAANALINAANRLH